jgi:hypothetical protein
MNCLGISHVTRDELSLIPSHEAAHKRATGLNLERWGEERHLSCLPQLRIDRGARVRFLSGSLFFLGSIVLPFGWFRPGRSFVVGWLLHLPNLK